MHSGKDVRATKADDSAARTSGADADRVATRLRGVAATTAAIIVGVSALGAFTSGELLSITYVVSLCSSALVLLMVARRHGRAQPAWAWVGGGLTVWALGGFLNTLLYDTGITVIPVIVPMLCYSLGYLPVVIGFAGLADPRIHTRRLSSIIDGVILLLSLYAVLWLLVVEQVAYDSTLSTLDRAFEALYPACDLTMLLLALRVVASRSAHRRVGLLLVLGSLVSFTVDVAIMVAYLVNPDGSYPVINFGYQLFFGMIAVAGVLSLSPGPPPVAASVRTASALSLVVAVSSLVPAVVLGVVVLFSHRQIALGPVASWLAVAALAVLARNLAGMRELERAHQQSMWLASHDIQTDMLRRAPFLHEVSEGSLRDRSGTVIVLEVTGSASVADSLGHDVVEHVVGVVAQRLTSVAGDGAVCARMAADEFAVFLRSNTLGRGRQVAGALQAALAEPIAYGDLSLTVEFSIGVAQADGAVIDVLAGVRRATEAMRHARRLGPGHVSVDADLTGTVLASSVQSGAPVRAFPVTPAP